MIDGVKIDVSNLKGSEWLNNSLLHFHTYTSVETGELLDGVLVAKYRGLKFFITKSIKYKNRVYYSVRGSLHKYHNNGNHNANDFSFIDIQSVIKDLHKKFNIEPKTAVLRNIEFGVNINTPVEAKEILKNLVSYGKYTFGTLKVEGLKVGKQITKQQSKLKIYDKGTQYKTKQTNLVRFEIVVRKMIYLNKYGIKTLADLQDSDKIKPLGSLLLSYWDDVIYYDKTINWKQLTEFERKKILYYATPRNWADFSIKQRYRAKKHFRQLLVKFSPSTTHKEIHTLVGNKWDNITAVICPQINHDFKEKSQTQNVHKLTVRIHSYFMDKTTQKKPTLKNIKKYPKKKAVLKRKKCTVCNTDISHKRTSTKFCSKKCNNKYHGKKRTQRNQKRISTEKQNLRRLLNIIPKNRLWLDISYRASTEIYTDTLHQSEIRTTKEWTKKIVFATITGHRKNSNPIILSSYRVRKLVTIINHKNK